MKKTLLTIALLIVAVGTVVVAENPGPKITDRGDVQEWTQEEGFVGSFYLNDDYRVEWVPNPDR